MLEETFGHTPLSKMFVAGDVYGVGFDKERASRRPIRLAIIGCGGVAISKHIPAIRRLQAIWEPVELAAICRRNKELGPRLASQCNCHWYPSHTELLDKEEIDGALVLSNDDAHAEQAIACIERGIPVLVEKPITSNSQFEALRKRERKV